MLEGSKKLNGVTVNMNLMPDSAQTLAVVAAFAEGKTIIKGLSTLKVKETDRLSALKKELGKMNIKSKITKDSIEIEGGKPQKNRFYSFCLLSGYLGSAFVDCGACTFEYYR